jgi:cytochrome c-type biogenesis protein CcmH/NrfF
MRIFARYGQWVVTDPLEQVLVWIIWRLPRRIVYWAAIRLMAHATTAVYPTRTPDGVTILEALDAWDVQR